MPDKELLQYFTTSPATACGRFHTHQLGRVIQPQKQRWNLPAYVRKIVAAFFAGLSFRVATAQAVKKQETRIVAQPTIKEKTTLLENIVISGRVTKGNEVAVANAKVSVDTLVITYTDIEGKFSITLNGDMVTMHNLYFSYEGLERTVRTFHPLMGSANYDVRLASKEDYQYSNYVMGLFVPLTVVFPSIKFYNKESFLNKDAKALLNFVAEKLKDNPDIMIQLVAFGGSVTNTKQASRKLKLIRYFLTEDLRIDKDRIVNKIEAAGSNNTIDILQYRGE